MNRSGAPVERRLFAGIALDERARAACADVARRLAATGFAARYEDPAKFHLTIAFLGNVPAARCDDVVAAVREAAAQQSSIVVSLDKLNAFPNERRPRVVYAGAREQGAAFRRLAAAVREALGRRGFHFAGDAVAHVTLARVKAARRSLPRLEVAPIRVGCDDLSLFESIFDKEKNTSRYEVFSRETLGRISEA